MEAVTMLIRMEQRRQIDNEAGEKRKTKKEEGIINLFSESRVERKTYMNNAYLMKLP